MKEAILAALTARNDAAACAFTKRILSESRADDRWYEYFDDVAALLGHPKSLVRNRALHILAENARWDEAHRFDAILLAYLAHVTDEKPITARQCIQCLAQIGQAQPQYIPAILTALKNADLSPYRDSMRPLLEKDIAKTVAALKPLRSH